MKRTVSQELLDWSRSVAMQARLKATLACAESFATTDFRGDLSAFRVPTRVIHGAAGQTVPIAATGRPAARGIRSATLLKYEAAPHGVFATHKQRLTNDLSAFVNTH